MFHSSHIHMPNRHRQRCALRTFFPSSSFSPPDSKEPLRRGILFSSIATILLLVGAILTWLGFNDVFGGKISMTGPLLIALALLMLLLSFRQFLLARKRNRTSNLSVQMENMNNDGGAPAYAESEDVNGTATIVVENWDGEDMYTNELHITARNQDELAPPSYTDIAHSYSSNCPSFFSHDDQNEAPPTYDEICARMFSYGSESSISNLEFSQTISPVELLQKNLRTHDGETDSGGFSQSLGETGGGVGSHLPATSHLPGGAQQNSETSPRNRNLSLIISSSDNEEAVEHSAQCCQRSFSSIPSYTCLLSESGEVSAQVYNTSSIIEEMMPPAKDQQLMSEPSSVPARSHSMSSVFVPRQGVPYTNIHLPPLPTSAILDEPNEQEPPPHLSSSNQSENISHPLSPCYGCQFRKASDSNILDLKHSAFLNHASPQRGHSLEFHSNFTVNAPPNVVGAPTVTRHSSSSLAPQQALSDSGLKATSPPALQHRASLKTPDVQETI
ncbi:uncharacterized protein LOC131943046 [Physella acuta]|uniref:uncharacterized protein LOC131943046 n=1 Tax=Physella acuta TaxID=109671 RepID=UPI0027DE806B|nr:uncharacterized protein LOC131943046 [Physella acuta]